MDIREDESVDLLAGVVVRDENVIILTGTWGQKPKYDPM